MPRGKPPLVDLTIKGAVAWLTLSRPQALNALSGETIERFCDHITALKSRSDIRVVVTRGEGRSFCAGSDLRELAGLSAREATRHELRVGEVCSLLDELPQPTIAMLHGHVLGGGMGLALYHDFRMASESAVLAMPEVELGWTPPWAVGRLVEAVGYSKANWLMSTSQRLSGAEAARIQLVNEAVPEAQLQDKVKELAQRFVSMPPDGLAQTKALLNKMSPYRRFEWDIEASKAFEICYSKPEAQQRVAGFLQKRKKTA